MERRARDIWDVRHDGEECTHWGVYLASPDGTRRVLSAFQIEMRSWLIAEAVKKAFEYAHIVGFQVILEQHEPQTDASGALYKNLGACHVQAK